MRLATRLAAAVLTVGALAAPVLPAQAATISTPLVVHVDTVANPDSPSTVAPAINYDVVSLAPFTVVNARPDAAKYTLAYVTSNSPDINPDMGTGAPVFIIPSAPTSSFGQPTYYLRRHTSTGVVNVASLTVIR